jgi:hypothetical protein
MKVQQELFCSAAGLDGSIEIPEGHAINVCFGGGVDSTAMLIALKRADIYPSIITFADTGAEKPETYEHVRLMDAWLQRVGFPTVTWCKLSTKASTTHNDLTGNCLDNETLPSLAFGMKSCSVKWKQDAQDNYIKGVNAKYVGKELPAHLANCHAVHPLWTDSLTTGRKIVKLIGYDSSTADIRRSSKIKTEDADFLYVYPLQQLGMTRADCIAMILEEGLPVPIKSACWFCPASKQWELYWLAGTHPELFEKACEIERTALLGKHSRFDTLQFGNWDVIVSSKEKRFPSGATSVGLGRSFSWCKFGVDQGFLDPVTWEVDRGQLEHLKRVAAELMADDNALDTRSC